MQPFVAVAREPRRYGHRVRLATHAVYREFIEEHSVEFFPLPGAPSLLGDFLARKGSSGRPAQHVRDTVKGGVTDSAPEAGDASLVRSFGALCLSAL